MVSLFLPSLLKVMMMMMRIEWEEEGDKLTTPMLMMSHSTMIIMMRIEGEEDYNGGD